MRRWMRDRVNAQLDALLTLLVLWLIVRLPVLVPVVVAVLFIVASLVTYKKTSFSFGSPVHRLQSKTALFRVFFGIARPTPAQRAILFGL
jgi:hypothetical protein